MLFIFQYLQIVPAVHYFATVSHLQGLSSCLNAVAGGRGDQKVEHGRQVILLIPS